MTTASAPGESVPKEQLTAVPPAVPVQLVALAVPDAIVTLGAPVSTIPEGRLSVKTTLSASE